MSRNEKLKYNTLTSVLLQIVTLASGFIIPQLILNNYGSSVNGLVSSIKKFLSLISFLDLGVGAVVKSALYAPLAQKDHNRVSDIYLSSRAFFKRTACIFIIYIIALSFIYPTLVQNEFDRTYTILLIIAISISSFSQYFFGITDKLLLTADQMGFIQNIVQIITVIVNTIVCSILIKMGNPIYLVQFMTSLIFLIRPILIRLYVSKKYKINKKIVLEDNPIPQKWDGMAQHFSAVILDNTDVVILTVFSSLSNVSVYSVYHMVLYGIKSIITSMVDGAQAWFGDVLAKKETKLVDAFGLFEWLIHNATVFVFGCTGTLIIPFVRVYTKTITDTNYIQSSFAVLITVAEAIHCLRLPYNVLILSAGHFKKTKLAYVIPATLNILLSIALVLRFGLVGVAIGTVISMTCQTVWMVWYSSKNIVDWPLRLSMKQIMTDCLCVFFGIIFAGFLKLEEITYFAWFVLAIKKGIIWALCIFVINSIIYNSNILKVKEYLTKKIKRNV